MGEEPPGKLWPGDGESRLRAAEGAG